MGEVINITKKAINSTFGDTNKFQPLDKMLTEEVNYIKYNVIIPKGVTFTNTYRNNSIIIGSFTSPNTTNLHLSCEMELDTSYSKYGGARIVISTISTPTDYNSLINSHPVLNKSDENISGIRNAMIIIDQNIGVVPFTKYYVHYIFGGLSEGQYDNNVWTVRKQLYYPTEDVILRLKSSIKSIQRGIQKELTPSQITTPSGSNISYGIDIKISPINPDKSFVLINFSGTEPPIIYDLTRNDLWIYFDSKFSSYEVLSWQIIEFW